MNYPFNNNNNNLKVKKFMFYNSINICTQPIDANNLGNVAKNSYNYLPIEIWVNIVKYCDLQTARVLSVLCKFNYAIITPLLERKIYQQKVPNNCLCYSINTYKSFISPILENLDLDAKNKIDLYLKEQQDNRNIKNIFPEFVFQQLSITAKKLPKTKGLIIELPAGRIDKFIMNDKSNHCATILKDYPNIINICQINFPFTIEKLDYISCLKEHEYIHSIKFTPLNNLLVIAKNTYEKNTIRLILFKLNLENDNNIEINQLWDSKINNIWDEKVIIFPNSNDTKFLIINNYESQLTTCLFIKEGPNNRIENFILFNKHLIPYKDIKDIIFSGNGLELAIFIRSNFYQGKLHLFSHNNNENFVEKSLPIVKNFDDIYKCNLDNTYEGEFLKFNTSGDICVYIGAGSALKLVMLNKIKGEWYCAMILNDSWYYGLGFTLDEKNIVFAREYQDTPDDEIKHNLEIMPIEDKILKKIPSECYIRDYCNKKTIKYKNFYHLEQNTNCIRGFTAHPSGLAIFAHNPKKNTIQAIFPQQLSLLNKSGLLLRKIAYYTKKALYTHT